MGVSRETEETTLNQVQTPAIEVTNLVKRFQRRDGERVQAIDDISLSVNPGEFVVLLGPSGCGKTTLLRCVAGLEYPDAGRIDIQGKTKFNADSKLVVPAEGRGLSMVFQSYALWPHMTVFENVAFPLRQMKVEKSEIKRRVTGALKRVGIPHLADSHPNQISGGQQQRVALARALVPNTGLILFDEPLSNVDARVRDELRFELLEMQREIGFAALYVTHDQSEAMTMADRIAVLGDGKIRQLAPPEEVYERPATRYVAGFVGTINELEGTVTELHAGGGVSVDTAIGKVGGQVGAGSQYVVGDQVAVVWRPENVRVTLDEVSGVNSWRGSIDASVFVGTHREALIDLGAEKIRAFGMGSKFPDAEAQVSATVSPEDVWVLPRD
ncbi:ABC transporter ATP-binding protein [Streptomyces sp. NPDC050625]|uniref:ABC transporter ATP-binding protein n=1 Tax=Streptomyces sp. NPDC050625 TaxID=3154629 RepID=UPI003447AB91